MKKFLLSALAVAILGTSAAFAQVVVRIAPPPPIVEHHRPVRPGPAYVWMGGYHRWDGAHYVWVPGRWAMPPHRGGVWVAGHWRNRRRGGWVWVPGHWRYARRY